MNFKSIRPLMSRIMQHPLLEELEEETIVNYAVEFLEVVGSPGLFMDKLSDIKIEQYRGRLPQDFYQLLQVNHNGKNLTPSNAFYFTTKHNECDKYKIQGDFIFFSNEYDTIEIVYKALSLDDDGIPLMPDDTIFLRALEAYIKNQYFKILFDLGKIQGNVLQKAEQDYAFYVGQCQNSFAMPSIAQMENIKNMQNTSTYNPNSFKTGF